MGIVKKLVLVILLLIVLTLCGTFVMKIMDFIFGLEYENIWRIGFKVGFLAWIILIVGYIVYKIRFDYKK